MFESFLEPVQSCDDNSGVDDHDIAHHRQPEYHKLESHENPSRSFVRYLLPCAQFINVDRIEACLCTCTSSKKQGIYV